MIDSVDSEGNNVVVLDSAVEDAIGFGDLKLLAVADADKTRAAINSYFDGLEDAHFELMTYEEFDQQGVVSDAGPPDILLLEVKDEKDSIEYMASIRAEDGLEGLHIALLMSKPTKKSIMNLMRNGADDVLSLAPGEIELSGSIARSNAVRQLHTDGNQSAEARKRELIVFLHASGGAGATTLAVNSAVHLNKVAQSYGGSACLIDFDVQFGDVDLHLDLPMQSNVIELVKSPDRLDFQMLENLMMTTDDGLRVLTAPEEPFPIDAFDKKTVEKVLALARRHNRYVVVDMPMTLTSWTDRVLRAADQIFIVTQMNVVALRSARRLIDALQKEVIGRASLSVIANRYPCKGQGRKITVGEAEKLLRTPISTQVVNDFQLLINSLDQGVPAVVHQPTSSYSKMIGKLVGVESEEKKSSFLPPFLRLGAKNV